MSKPLNPNAPLNPHADVVAWDGDQGIQLYPVGERYFLYVGVNLVAICCSHVELQNQLKTLTVEQHIELERITMVPQQCYLPVKPGLSYRELFREHAAPCPLCCNAEELDFKFKDLPNNTVECWVACRGCREVGPKRSTEQAAGAAWNQINAPD